MSKDPSKNAFLRGKVAGLNATYGPSAEAAPATRTHNDELRDRVRALNEAYGDHMSDTGETGLQVDPAVTANDALRARAQALADMHGHGAGHGPTPAQ
jgi:hypothetical protein